MPVHLNLLIAASYALFAAAVAVAVPSQAVPTPYLLGGLVVLAGALAHVLLLRHFRDRDAREELAYLNAAYRDLKSEIDALRIGMARAHVELRDARAQTEKAGGPAMSEIVAEVRVLQSLIERLHLSRQEAVEAKPAANEETPPAAAVAGAARPTVLRPLRPPVPAVATGLDEAQILDIVRDGLRADRIDLFLQPVLSLPQRKRRFYECYSRIRTADGTMITPEQYIAVAAREGLLDAIDNMLLFRCVQLVRKARLKHRDVGFFCNISPGNLSDKDFFTDFVEFMAQNAELAPHLFFEFAQADAKRFDATILKQLAFLANYGFRFSLDRVSDLRLDLRELKERRFAFVKLDAAFLLESIHGEKPVLDLHLLKGALDRAGLDLVVEKVERDQQLIELLDYQIDYAQGFLFGEPRPSREI
ncbi:MAG TPA: EAL domain-containing protein [Alphaproteobacteria bacterium]|nr:EAL domain-containing protein [Alphaproteobacteria bacterium]